MSLHERLYRFLLRAYPRRFRRDVGPELLRAFSRQLDRATGRGRLRLSVRELADLARNLPGEWWATLVRARQRGDWEGGRSRGRPRFLAADVRVALRGFRKRPGFLVTAVAVLGLGIGATTAVFTVVNAVLLRPLPYGDADRLVTVWQTAPSWSESPNPILQALAFEFPLAWDTYRDWLEMNTSFSALGVYDGGPSYAMTGRGDPQVVIGVEVSSGVFAVLGVPPLLGRTFVSGDDEPGAPPLAVLSHGLWASRFGADSTVLGETVMIDEVTHTIVGVMPPSFYFPWASADLWLSVPDYRKEGGETFWGIARLRPDMSIEQAQADMEAVNRHIEETDPRRPYGVRLVNRRETVVGDVRPVLGLLVAAVVTVLLITCANIANLLLMRSSERRQELAIRTALGAGRARILTQLLTESLMLALMGGAVGLFLAVVGLEPLVAWLPPDVPRASEIQLDGTVLLVSALLSMGTGLVMGILPALRAARVGPATALSDSGTRAMGGRSRTRMQHSIVLAEVALSFVLLVGAGLLVRSMANVSSIELGFGSDDVVALRLEYLGERYETDEARRVLCDQLRDRLAALPGVSAVSGSAWIPFVGNPWGNGFYLETASGREWINVGWNRVGESYFDLLRIPLMSGRAFGPEDMGAEPRTAIISETMARTYWPGRDPVGERFRRRDDGPELTIVGVAGDIRHPGYGSDLTTEPRSLVYLPAPSETIFALRADGDPSLTISAALAVVRELDPDLPVVARIIADEIHTHLAGPRFRTWAVGLLAGLAALLAAVGVYGVLSYAVTQRTREIGIRMALGADARSVLQAVIGRGLFLIGTGMAVGLAVVFLVVAAAPAFQGLLYEVGPTDPGSIGAVALLLGAAGMVATILPAMRATAVDPGSTLRRE